MRRRLLQTSNAARPYLYTDRGVLGLITANDLLWRTLADVRWTAVHGFVETIGESIVIPAVVSLLAGFDTELQTVALAAQWIFVCGIYYTLTPRVFRRSARRFTADITFRLATVVASLGFALSIASFTLDTPVSLESPHVFAASFSIAMVVAVVAYGWYFRRIQGWRWRSVKERIDLLDEFIPVPPDERDELLAGIKAPGVWSTVRTHALFVAVVIICVVTAFIFGVLSVFILGLYPLVEILVLISVVVTAIAGLYDMDLDRDGSLRQTLDVEDRLYSAISTMNRGVKAMTALFLIVVFGLGTQVIAFAGALQLVFDTTLSAVLPILRSGIGSVWAFVIIWNLLGTSSLLLASIYGAWFWLRMLERLPAFLDIWEVAKGQRDEISNEAGVTRPVGVMLPPSLAFFATTVWVVLESSTAPGALAVHEIGYAIAWPTIVGMMLLSVWRTHRKPPQDARSDNVALPLSLLIQFGIGFAFFWLENLGSQETVSLSIGFSPFAAISLLAIPWIFYWQDIYQWGEQQSGVSSYALPAYITGFGIVVLLFGAIGEEWPIYSLLFSIVVIGGGVVLAIDQYFSK